jgi:hypothetical protein
MPAFERYIGIDYSGAKTAESSLKGIRVYVATRDSEPQEELSPLGSPDLRNQPQYWSRRRLATWLLARLSDRVPTIIGIDHAFSFPSAYFRKHGLPLNWPAFLHELQHHCPTDKEYTYVDSVRDGLAGCWEKVAGDPSWLRLTESWTPSAKSVFQFDVQGAVAKATYAGIPWLLFLRTQLDGNMIHFWPFDGWDVPQGRNVIAEVYPSLWMRRFPRENRDSDQHAAYSVSAWLRRADQDGTLPQFFRPPLTPEEHKSAEVEGWILGVV